MRLGRLLLKRIKRPIRKRVKRPVKAGKNGSSAKIRVSAGKRRAQQNLPVLYEGSATSPESPPIITTLDLIRPQDRLKQSIEGFLLDQRSPHTRRAYSKDLKRFVRFLILRKNGMGAEELTRSVLIAYKDNLLADQLEHTTIDRHLATLRSFFKWLVDDGLIAKSPADSVRFMNPRRMSKTVGLTDQEVAKILSLPDLHTRTGAQHYAILMILFYCGLRRSEVCALRTSNISQERNHTVLKLRGKGNAERIVVLKPAVWKAITHHLKMSRKELAHDQFLFSPIRNNRTGVMTKELDSSTVFYMVTGYAKKAGVAARVSPHSCRATAISNARDHKVSDRAIQEFAGWASPDMITRYDKRRTAVEQSASHAIDYGAGEREMPIVPSAYPVSVTPIATALPDDLPGQRSRRSPELMQAEDDGSPPERENLRKRSSERPL